MAKTESVDTTPQPAAIPPAVDALIDARWPSFGDAWQQQQSARDREAFRAELTTILVPNQ